MASLLPAANYQSPPRPVRGTTLNTIIEDQREGGFGQSNNESGTDTDEGTVIYNPINLNATSHSTDRTRQNPAPPLPLSNNTFQRPTIRAPSRRPQDFDELYDVSDEETEFSESSLSLRDSVSSRPTSFATDSTRNSIVSSRSESKHRYPAIMIPPSNMWPSLMGPTKGSPAVPPTPPPKIPVSPAALSLLPRFVPAINAPPSLDGSSMTSDQVSCISAPVTPDMQNVKEGERWDGQPAIRLRRDGDSVRDGTESESGSPHDQVVIEQAIDWDEVGNFPRIPGATPQEMSPVLPNMEDFGVLRQGSPSDRGVLLPSAALRTLNQLAPERRFDVSSNSSSIDQAEMREKVESFSRPRSADGATPASNLSGYSFSELSIPSPGGFFSSLKSGIRHTWFPGTSRHSNPPSSTTAENFYNVPWNQPQNVVEQVVEFEESNTDGPPTARQHFADPLITPKPIVTDFSLASPTDQRADHELPSSVEAVKEITPSSELRYEYEEAYENELKQGGTAHLDRTSNWLAAQISYLSVLRETNPANNMSESACPKRESMHERKESADSSLKKVVRFLEETSRTKPKDENQIGQREEHAYYHAFQHLSQHRKRRDSFLHATPRFDAIQAGRIALSSQHIDQLRGKYEVREPTRPKYSGPFSQNPRATGVADYTAAQMAFMEVEREKGVLDQISPSYWIIDALKYLNGGNLLLSNASKRLAKAQFPLQDPHCIGKKRIRALDLGGNPSCDWAWHCARQFPNVKTYTFTTTQTTTGTTAATATSITGPPNHRLLTAPHLSKLPFKDNQFDLISARTLHSLLKPEPVPGHRSIDEYTLCLNECYRVLKPGGYLEFSLMDADMSHPGPLANALSVEFAFKLKTRGYDPAPTRAFLGRLREARFVDIKRAWLFLPAGGMTSSSMGLEGGERKVGGEVVPLAGRGSSSGVGSTKGVADLTGLVGSCMWEQWMLKLQAEMMAGATGGEDEKRLCGSVARVVEESRGGDAGWRLLSGWARKPRGNGPKKMMVERVPTSETIHVKIEE